MKVFEGIWMYMRVYKVYPDILNKILRKGEKGKGREGKNGREGKKGREGKREAKGKREGKKGAL